MQNYLLQQPILKSETSIFQALPVNISKVLWLIYGVNYSLLVELGCQKWLKQAWPEGTPAKNHKTHQWSKFQLVSIMMLNCHTKNRVKTLRHSGDILWENQM